jgi:hypothetical protein
VSHVPVSRIYPTTFTHITFIPVPEANQAAPSKSIIKERVKVEDAVQVLIHS